MIYMKVWGYKLVGTRRDARSCVSTTFMLRCACQGMAVIRNHVSTLAEDIDQPLNRA